MAIKHDGPFGGNGVTNWSIDNGQGDRIKTIKIRSGHVVDGIGFKIADSMGTCFVVWFGGQGGGVSEITLQSDERITQISGTQGRWCFTKTTIIGSLRIHTNRCPQGYGPFGAAMNMSNESSFSTTYVEDHVIFALSGRVDDYLTSITTYSKPYIQSNSPKAFKLWPQELAREDHTMMTHGPYGGNGDANWSIDSPRVGKIRKITIKSGHVVDGIGFEIMDSLDTCYTIWFGGQGGGASEITLSQGEYVTQVSGTQGWWRHSRTTLISSINIHTNTRPEGYGPFGAAMNVSENSPFSTTHPEDHAIVAFCGRAEEFLTSITAYSKPYNYGNYENRCFAWLL